MSLTPASRLALRWLAGALCLGAFLVWARLSVDLTSLRRAFVGGHLLSLLLLTPLLVWCVWGLRALRWIVILKAFGTPLPVLPTVLTTGMSLGLAAVTPLQAGELLKLGQARTATGLPFAAVASGYAVERLADLTVVLAFTALTIQQVLPRTSDATIEVGFGFALAVALLAIALAWRLGGRIEIVRQSLQAFGVVARRHASHVLVWSTTILAWGLTGVLWQTTMAAVDVHVGFLATLSIVGLTVLVGLMSFIPAAIGVAEISIAALLGALGHNADACAAAAISLRLITVVGVASGLLCWLALRATRGVTA